MSDGSISYSQLEGFATAFKKFSRKKKWPTLPDDLAVCKEVSIETFHLKNEHPGIVCVPIGPHQRDDLRRGARRG